MLAISDVNASHDKINLIEELKDSFRNRIANTANEGSVVLINNVPSVGDVIGNLDFLISLSITKKYKNYLVETISGNNIYIDNFILALKKIDEKDILGANEEFLYTDDGELNYLEIVKKNIYSLENFVNEFSNLRIFFVYYIDSNTNFVFRGRHLLINVPLTANELIKCVVHQSMNKFGQERICSTEKGNLEFLYEDNNLEFCKLLLDKVNKFSKIGILTKEKINRITKTTKIIDSISDNAGSRICIISGNAGTGKTLVLQRIMFESASNNQRIRYITYNNLLVLDIKQNLRSFGFFGDFRISVTTIHYFFRKLVFKLGIPLILSENRVNELLTICERRVDRIIPILIKYKSDYSKITSKDFLFSKIIEQEKNKADYNEIKEFLNFLVKQKDLRDFFSIKDNYLKEKKSLLFSKIGKEVFLEDYYKVLELLLEAITDSESFYLDYQIKDRYELLGFLYRLDDYESNKVISFTDFEKQVKALKRTVNWSSCLLVDEGQDFHILEKHVLFRLKGPESIIVASGGKSQLIRHSKILDWSVSFGHKISSAPFNLSKVSYRQKHNIIQFVNFFSNHYGFNLSLNSSPESTGLGKIIIDKRPKKEFINEETLRDLSLNGSVSGCSTYESLLFLIPSRGYTRKEVYKDFRITETDQVIQTEQSENRVLNEYSVFTKNNIFPWIGISERKSTLSVPNQNECRIIHYESCRGLESWSVACLGLDSYFLDKKQSNEAGEYLLDDLFFEEEERREKYAAQWCLMAFTRPMDTLYIQLNDSNSKFSKLILKIADSCPGVTVKS